MFDLILLLAMSSLSDSPASAVPQSDPNQILVEGNRSREQAIHDFVGAVTPGPSGDQLRRFQFAACPAATGLSDLHNRQVAARLRKVASAVGVPLAPERCAPNVLVIAVPNKAEFLIALRRKYPVFFADTLGGIRPIPREAGPAAAWHVEGMLTVDHTIATISGCGNACPSRGGKFFIRRTTDASRLRPSGIPHFWGGILVVETNALAGLTTTQLADYAALRLYASTNPTRLKPTANTILGILETPIGQPVPETLTTWDLAFLKGLYASNDRQYATQQRGDIERTVQKEVKGSATER